VRGSLDTYDMVNGAVSHADEYLGQERMNNEQLYAALRHVREQLAPVLTKRRRRRQHAEQEQQHE